MKHVLLLVLGLLTGAVSLSGSITYKIHFYQSKLRTSQLSFDGKDYTEVEYDGLYNTCEFGQASLPCQSISFAVPFDAGDFKIDCKVENVSEIAIKAPVYDNPNINWDGSIEYGDGEPLLDNIMYVTSGFMKGAYRYLDMSILPIIQKVGTDNLYFCADITVTIDWTPKLFSEIRQYPSGNYNENDNRHVKESVVNPEDVDRYKYDPHRPDPGSRMVVEGRTWWYETFARASVYEKRYLEIGIGIREEVEVDGVRWHKIKVVADRILDANAELLEIGEKDLCIGYIRETPEDVYVMLDSEGIRQHDVLAELIANTGWYFEDGKPYLLYHFGFIGDKFVMGFPSGDRDLYSVNCEVDSRETVSYGSYRYVRDLIKSDGELLHQEEKEYFQIEGIGQFSSEDYPCGELFFVPMYPPLADFGYDVMKLRYVTNSRNNRVIYEREGGLKLWKELGVANVEADAAEAPVRWFNLQGIEVAGPDVPGIYLKVSGGRAEKITVE